jgi:exodeoxyribonuclease VII large subunit
LPRTDTLTAHAQQRLDMASARLPNALTARVNRGRSVLSEAAGALRPSLVARTIQGAKERTLDRSQRLAPALERRLNASKNDLERLSPRFDMLSLKPQIERRSQDLSALLKRFKQAADAQQTQHFNKLQALDRLRLTLGYKATLDRGYAVVRSGDGDVLTTRKTAKTHATLEIEFGDGTLSLGAKKPTKNLAPDEKKNNQGSLF